MQKNQEKINIKRNEIEELINSFGKEYLTNEYNALCKNVIGKVVEIYGDAIQKGKIESWAAGIVHAVLSTNNMLSQKSELKASKIYEVIGISSSAALSKSKDIRATLNNGELSIEACNEEEVAATVEVKEVISKEVEKVEELKEIIKDVPYLLAQDIMKKAWESKNFKNKIKLAKEAIEICPKCSDAYIILSKDNSLNNEEKEEVLKKALQIAIHNLGANNIEDINPNDWRKEDLTPLFAAQYKLSVQQWENGKGKDAINNLKNILKLDVEDKLMVRGIMVNWLIIEKCDEELDEILSKHRTDYLTSIHYTDALNKFSKGNMEEAERAIKKAYSRNPFVLDYITKKKRVNETLPQIKQYGTEEEAIHYMKDGINAWKSVDGAIDWIKKFKKTV